jgi:hypothetical protein
MSFDPVKEVEPMAVDCSLEALQADSPDGFFQIFESRVLGDNPNADSPPQLSGSLTPLHDLSSSPGEASVISPVLVEFDSSDESHLSSSFSPEQAVAASPVEEITLPPPKRKKFGLSLTLEVPQYTLTEVVTKPKTFGPYDPNIRFCLPQGRQEHYRVMRTFREAASTVRACEMEQDPKQVRKMLPRPTSNSGVNGSYFIRDRHGRNVLVFKPLIGEQFQKAGDCGYMDTQHMQLKDGIERGGSCVRECVAYYLGRDCGVPPTAEMTLRCGEVFTTTFHSPTYENLRGSAQMFIHGRSIADLQSGKGRPSRVRRLDRLRFKQVSTAEFHRLFLFDLRTVNSDRHPGNLFLTASGRFGLIDNGCILAGFKDNLHYCWMDWESVPALHEPFDRRVISELDCERDIEVIRENYPDLPETALDTLRISEYVLKEATNVGLTPFEIGHFYEQSLNMNNWKIAPINLLLTTLERYASGLPKKIVTSWIKKEITEAVKLFPIVKEQAMAALLPGKTLDYNKVWTDVVNSVCNRYIPK